MKFYRVSATDTPKKQLPPLHSAYNKLCTAMEETQDYTEVLGCTGAWLSTLTQSELITVMEQVFSELKNR